jgi:hypothetical protein
MLDIPSVRWTDGMGSRIIAGKRGLWVAYCLGTSSVFDKFSSYSRTKLSRMGFCSNFRTLVMSSGINCSRARFRRLYDHEQRPDGQGPLNMIQDHGWKSDLHLTLRTSLVKRKLAYTEGHIQGVSPKGNEQNGNLA